MHFNSLNQLTNDIAEILSKTKDSRGRILANELWGIALNAKQKSDFQQVIEVLKYIK